MTISPDKSKSDTPRTDEARWLVDKGCETCVPGDFARQLERELAWCRDLIQQQANRLETIAPSAIQGSDIDWKAEAERYRKGMENWKATAEAKDEDFRIQCAALESAKARLAGAEARIAELEAPPSSVRESQHDWMDEARMIARQCWCDDETSGIEMDARLANAFARRLAAWMQTGALHATNEEYWRERAFKAETSTASAIQEKLA